MIIHDLDIMDAALLKRLAPWVSKAAEQIGVAVADAHAHAIKALTVKLKATTDGRPSARVIKQSPSYDAALGHLTNLQTQLIGPTSVSLEGTLRDAQADFYESSLELWLPYVDSQYRVVPNPQTTVAGEKMMRGAIISGYSLFDLVAPEIATAQRTLRVALNVAAKKGIADRLAQVALSTWSSKTRSRLATKCETILSNAQVSIHAAMPHFIVDPVFHGQMELPVGGLHF